MSDELKKKGTINFRDILNQTKQTFEEAEAQIKAESFAKRADRFRMDGDGEYSLRILPLVPELDAEGNVLPMERHGFEYPVHQQFLKIELPGKEKDKKNSKGKTISIPVINTTDKGCDKSVDLIDTYVKIAKEMYADDAALMELLDKSPYYGGLKWSFTHAMYVLDLTKEGTRKGPLLWHASHSQYCDIRDAKQRLWIKERQKDPNRDCPVCGFENAYPITIIRETTNKTEYTVEIDRYTDDLTDEELGKLFDMPRIPEQIYGYSRYLYEATLVFLQQYDEKHDMEVCKEQDFIDAAEKLKGELDPDDKSHFDINNSGNDKDKNGGKDEVTVNSLWAELDAIEDAGLGEKSDEYQELREKIRQFIEDNDLDIRLTRSKNNEALIKEVEEAIEDKESNPSSTKSKDEEPEKNDEPEKEEKEEKKERRSRSRRSADDEEDEENESQKEDEEPEKEEPRSRRRPRPSDDEEPDDEKNDEPEKEEEAPADEEEQPRTRARRRR